MAERRRLSWFRMSYFIFTIAASVLGGYFGGDAMRLAEKPAEYIGVIFSILAASLFAVVSIVGDPGMLVSGSARAAWENAKEIQRELHQFNVLFYIYLITLALLVVSELAEAANWQCWYWLTNVFTGFAIGGFLLSLSLPIAFQKLQQRRLEQEINSRRKRGESG